MRVLLIEDDRKAARLLAKGLREEGFSDTGPGIAPEDVPRLFQRYYRGKASRATDVPGVGLGLAIARALVERQGGRITVATPGKQGATFTVHLPRT